MDGNDQRFVSGIVTGIVDSGSVVQVFIDGHPYAADGNLWRHSPVSEVVEEGTEVGAYVSDWSGLECIAPLVALVALVAEGQDRESYTDDQDREAYTA